jgi:hypothetical protein
MTVTMKWTHTVSRLRRIEANLINGEVTTAQKALREVIDNLEEVLNNNLKIKLEKRNRKRQERFAAKMKALDE